MSEKKNCSVWAPRFLLAAGVSLGVFFACLYAVIQITDENPKAYILAVVLSALCFLLVFYLLGRTPLAARPALFGAAAPGKVPVLRVLIFAAYVALVFVLDRSTRLMLGKREILTKEDYGIALVIPLFLLLAALVPAAALLWLYRREKPGERPAWLRFGIPVLAAAGALLCTWLGYRPNVGWHFIDYAAYWENVIALYNGSCFSMEATSYYGHYALFMLPYFKLVGLNAFTIAATQAVENLIVYLASLYYVFKVTRSDTLRICGILGSAYSLLVSSLLYVTGFYPQQVPHRLVFPALMMVLGVQATVVRTPPRKYFFALGYAVAVLSIVWNLETGMVLLVSWALLHFLHSWYACSGKTRWLHCTAAVCAIPAGFFLAWQSVSIINQVLLGNWERMSLRDFVFPLFTSYISAIHQAPLDFSTFHWVAAAIFLLLCLFIGLRDFVLGHSSPRRLLVIYLAAMSLMNALYFFNRPAYSNLRLAVYYPALLLILLLMDHTGNTFRAPVSTAREELKAGVFAGHMYGFALLLVLSVAVAPATVRTMRGFQDTAALDCIPHALEEAGVPADTILFTEYASFIDVASDKYSYTDMSLVNPTTTSLYLLGQKLLRAEHPFMISSGLLSSRDPVTANEFISIWFASLTDEKTWEELYELPQEIAVHVKSAAWDYTEWFYLFMPRA